MIRYALGPIPGAALGVASALYLAGLWPGMKPLDFGNVEVDGWRSDFAIGSKAADPYTRARVARHGLLALAKSEAVYFTRTTDADGEPLREECDYSLSGAAMPAQWWSITLYNAESYLPDNSDDALSVDATSVSGETEEWAAIISSNQPKPGINWLSSRKAGKFDLTLRLYVPSEALFDEPAAVFSPPMVERLSCEGGAT
ncbi:MAG: DUF1214 domain-containing protein [Pseudomonadota bacterium]